MSTHKNPTILKILLGLTCLVFLLTTLFWDGANIADAEPGHSKTIDNELPLFTQTTLYSVEQVMVGGATEYRFIANGHHFMTLIDENGTFNFRPHPGRDINGWGSSWYFQPFLPGAELKHTVIDTVEAQPGGIHVVGSGQVSRDTSDTYGTWAATLDFQYSTAEKMVTGTSVYSVTLAGQLSGATGDLNLYRIASNYLDDVPLLTGQNGDTGDMEAAEVEGQDFQFTWIPPEQSAHFPNNKTSWLSVNVKGWFNNVDTAAMGYAPIASAFKPSLKVVVSAPEPDVEMIFGGIYTLADNQKFWADNVGITPLILQGSSKTIFHFNIAFESKATGNYIYLPLVIADS